MNLLTRFRDGDLEAFEVLFRQNQAEVFGWIVRIVRDRGVAEDLTVETFWRMYQARGRFNPDASLGAWARRIATNCAIDYLRHSRRGAPLSEQIPQAPSSDPVLRREMRDQIAAAFRRLPVTLRVTATLALIEERSHQEIADALHTSAGAVRVRVSRAVRLLRQQLTRMGMTP
jgi:RNA polymerase sigma-70 factor, ECF subfamily